MTALLSITADPARRMIRLTSSGSVSIAEIDEAERELLDTLTRLGWKPRGYALLVDNRRRHVASQQVVARIRDFLANDAIAPAKLAVLVDGMLSKLQSRRLEPRNPTFFEEDEALAWLAA